MPFEYDRKRAIKQTGFTKCIKCGKGMAHAGIPLFYRITVEPMGIDHRAVQRQHGLEMMMAGAAKLAHIMGPDDDMGLPIGPALTGLICHLCAHDFDATFGELIEALSRANEKQEADSGAR